MGINQLDMQRLLDAIEVLDRIQDADVRLHQDILMAAAVLGKLARAAGPTAQVSRPRVDGMAVAQAERNYAGLSVSEAAVKYLGLIRRSQRVKEIIEGLSSSGFEMTAERPEIALTTALKRRAVNYTDLVNVAHGAWCLREFLNPKEQAALEHKERTSRGMQQAKSRGVSFGQAGKITPVIEAEIELLVKSGHSIDQIAKKIKITAATIRKRFPKSRLDVLRAQGKASLNETDDSRPSLRVVGN